MILEELRCEFHTMLLRAEAWLATEDAETHFNMRFWHEDVNEYPDYARFPGQCGTVMCIGGYISSQPDISPELHDNIHATCMELFYPPWEFGKYRKITPAQAQQAVRNYLEHGNPKWNHIIPA